MRAALANIGVHGSIGTKADNFAVPDGLAVDSIPNANNRRWTSKFMTANILGEKQLGPVLS